MMTFTRTRTQVLPADLEAGDEFDHNPRNGNVVAKVICRYGNCDHDDRPDSVHVRSYGVDFFVALIPTVTVDKL